MGLTVAIAGCGIAGLASAALLARQGAKVVVFDKMDRPAPLGSGLILQPVGLAVLEEIGAAATLKALGASVKRLFGKVQPSGRVVLDVRYAALGAGKACGLAVHRGALFEALLAAATAAGVELVSGKEIVGADATRLKFADGTSSAVFDLVVDALGVNSMIGRSKAVSPLPFGALWANLDFAADGVFDGEALEQRYEWARKMVGVLPIGSLRPGEKRQAAFFWSLRHADEAAWRGRPIAAWKEDVLKLWPETAPLVRQIDGHDDLIFASYAHGTRGAVSDGVAHVGDSWHCASPQLGQGANMALLDASALAAAVGRAASVEEALELYAWARRGHIWLYQTASWMFTPAYQSDGWAMPLVRDWMLSPIARVWPAPVMLASLVAGAVGSPLGAIRRLRG